MQEFLVTEQVKWKFNLSRAPRWGGQFKRMVGLVNQCLYKATGKAKFTKQEVEEVTLGTKMNLNNRLLVYIDDDTQFPVLTPNILIHGQPIKIPEEQFDDDEVIKKRQPYIKCCKDAASIRWNKEYLRSLRERHNMENNQRHTEIAIEDDVLIKKLDKRCGKWNISVVEELYERKNNLIRAVKFPSRKTYIKRLIKFPYPLELNCDT